jgi:hypothetical protein
MFLFWLTLLFFRTQEHYQCGIPELRLCRNYVKMGLAEDQDSLLSWKHQLALLPRIKNTGSQGQGVIRTLSIKVLWPL